MAASLERRIEAIERQARRWTQPQRTKAERDAAVAEFMQAHGLDDSDLGRLGREAREAIDAELHAGGRTR